MSEQDLAAAGEREHAPFSHSLSHMPQGTTTHRSRISVRLA
jgi:hypothetical protein